MSLMQILHSKKNVCNWIVKENVLRKKYIKQKNLVSSHQMFSFSFDGVRSAAAPMSIFS